MGNFKAKIESKIEKKQEQYQVSYQQLQKLEQEANALNQQMFKIAGAIDELSEILEELKDEEN